MRGYNIHLSLKESASLYVALITCLLLSEIRKIHLQKTKFWYFGGEGLKPQRLANGLAMTEQSQIV